MGISGDHHTRVLTAVLIGHEVLDSNQSIIDLKCIDTPANEGGNTFKMSVENEVTGALSQTLLGTFVLSFCSGTTSMAFKSYLSNLIDF